MKSILTFLLIILMDIQFNYACPCSPTNTFIEMNESFASQFQTATIIPMFLWQSSWSYPIEGLAIGLLISLIVYYRMVYSTKLFPHEKLRLILNITHKTQTPLTLIHHLLEEIISDSLSESTSQKVKRILRYTSHIMSCYQNIAVFDDKENELHPGSSPIEFELYTFITSIVNQCRAYADTRQIKLNINKDTIDGLIMITQTPDYFVPPTSCIVQHRLGLDNCGLVYDSNIGCTAFPFGLQMACANIMAGCKRILLLVGDANPNRGETSNKDGLLFGDAGVAIIVEKTDEDISPINIAIETIGSGYKSLITPYGMERHPLPVVAQTRGFEFAAYYNNATYMSGTDVFTFSIKDAPRTTKTFLANLGNDISDFDLVSIHQANKMIIDNVAKRIKAPQEKVINSIERFGNTRGASTAVNICDYAENNNIYEGDKKILALAFGIGLNVTVASFTIDMSVCLPIIKTSEVYDDGIDSETYFK